MLYYGTVIEIMSISVLSVINIDFQMLFLIVSFVLPFQFCTLIKFLLDFKLHFIENIFLTNAKKIL